MDELLSSKAYARQKFKAGRGGHRGGRTGHGRGTALPSNPTHEMETDHMLEDNSIEEEQEEAQEASSSQRLDFAALVTEARSYYEQSFYRNQSFHDVDKEEVMPPPHEGIDRSVIALDLPALAHSLLSGLKISEILGIEDTYLSNCLELEGQTAPPAPPAPPASHPPPICTSSTTSPSAAPSDTLAHPIRRPDRTDTKQQGLKGEDGTAKMSKEPQRTSSSATATATATAKATAKATEDEDDLDALLSITKPKVILNPLPQVHPVAVVTLPPKQTLTTASSSSSRDPKTSTAKTKSLEEWLDD